MICENCKQPYTDNKWFGCCCSDCYTGRKNSNNTKKFLELVNTVKKEIDSAIKQKEENDNGL